MVATDEQIVDAIAGFIAERGYSPTVREICRMVGIKTPSSVARRLHRLRARGVVAFDDRRPRTIRITGVTDA